MQYVCEICGWLYNEAEGAPDHGIAPNTKWAALPDDFTCPMCGADKDLITEEA